VVERPAEPPDAAPDPRELVHGAMWRDEIDEAVHRLPERLRLPVVLYFYEELTGPEIAAALGCNPSTVWSRIYAAHRELRKQLQPPEGGDDDAMP
jgi:RNA polymerase sigma-70 factor (ECF subfamily)